MATFSYFESTGGVSVDAGKDEKLSETQAQVIATLQVAEELEAMNSKLSSILEILQTGRIGVDVVG